MDGDCPFCDYEGDTYQGWTNHFRVVHDDDDRYPLVAKVGRERLEELYSRMGTQRVGEELGVTKRTVKLALDAADIDTRTMSESWELRREREDWTAPPEEYRTAGKPNHTWVKGYSVVHVDGHQVRVHRLCAAAWFGLDEIKDRIVHHESEARWDNREENLRVMTPSEHWTHHHNVWWERGVNLGDVANRD